MTTLGWTGTFPAIKNWIAILSLFLLPSISSGQTILFTEDFENTNLLAKGWYDNTSQTFSAVEHIPGSNRSLEYHWIIGGKQPTSGGSLRRAFTPTPTLYVSYWVKYSSNYVGNSPHSYHPHEFYILTNDAGPTDGLAWNKLDFYIEQGVGTSGNIRPRLEIQDGEMIDTGKIGVDLKVVTENRAVAGGNGNHNTGGTTTDGLFGGSDYYQSGGTWYNNYDWIAPSVTISKNAWHHIEVYAQLNTINGGIGQQDGIIRHWVDGTLSIENTAVIFRTGANPGLLFNQFVIAPYIGDGSLVDQKFWIDNLTLATSRVTGLVPPAPPQNLRIQ